MTRVFIDGKEGTTGLKIYDRLACREDIELIALSEEKRKDPLARAKALNSCDIAFLCLPDEAAREAISMVENPNVRIIDASTAHRTQPGWDYGFPELSKEHFENIRVSKRVAVPGCHACGFIALVYPLVKYNLISPSATLACHSITGYSGGGKKMIARYEAKDRDPALDSPRQYATAQAHKHLREMTKICALETPPLFCPIVADFYSGMEVTVCLHARDAAPAGEIRRLYERLYTSPIVTYDPSRPDFLPANALAGKDNMKIFVLGNDDRLLLVALFDNLGKGASGSAVECLNIMTGRAPQYSLAI